MLVWWCLSTCKSDDVLHDACCMPEVTVSLLQAENKPDCLPVHDMDRVQLVYGGHSYGLGNPNKSLHHSPCSEPVICGIKNVIEDMFIALISNYI